MSRLQVAVLASHNGSNLRALHRAALAADALFTVALVISNNSGSGALAFAREAEIPALHLSTRTHPDPDALDEAMCSALSTHSVDLVVTAGYMKKLGPRVRSHYASRIINIHPALLPRHGGKGMYGRAVHESVLATGDKISGPTVHILTDAYDSGPIIARREVPVLPDDTPDTLASRVLAAEHELLPEVVQRIAGRREMRPGLPTS
ncbi:phosphoribosylglycinamide formyltransferase [Nocardia blacklockiae]|uniref:phosphoribosylglycinamide formyltransferase n=1 Tax=Nocardia blacklockiae TaxID=480036 RepID=UPI001894FD5A|nr:phosphoribosylglycinamide formyltransferase [Nocardia blacklockiae]MBF6171306.1 phosphoribosylglycinamide formyltransferase [Nocardia blacklockiae]